MVGLKKKLRIRLDIRSNVRGIYAPFPKFLMLEQISLERKGLSHSHTSNLSSDALPELNHRMLSSCCFLCRKS